jgi:hypothetical protein
MLGVACVPIILVINIATVAAVAAIASDAARANTVLTIPYAGAIPIPGDACAKVIIIIGFRHAAVVTDDTGSQT